MWIVAGFIVTALVSAGLTWAYRGWIQRTKDSLKASAQAEADAAAKRFSGK